MFDYQTGEDLVNAIMRPLGTNLKNYEMVWKEKSIAVASDVVAELTTLRAQNAALVEALENTTQALQDELDSRGATDDMLDEEDEVIAWLGKDYGRKTIGLLIRLRQARNALAQVAG